MNDEINKIKEEKVYQKSMLKIISLGSKIFSVLVILGVIIFTIYAFFIQPDPALKLGYELDEKTKEFIEERKLLFDNEKVLLYKNTGTDNNEKEFVVFSNESIIYYKNKEYIFPYVKLIKVTKEEIFGGSFMYIFSLIDNSIYVD